MDTITYVGLDVHKETISVALAESGRDGEVRKVGVFENRPEVLSKLMARLSKGGCRLSFCYEAGPPGHPYLTVLIRISQQRGAFWKAATLPTSFFNAST